MPGLMHDCHAADGAGALRARAFGTSRQDLDVDFGGGNRARIVTALLVACLRRDGEAALPDDEIEAWTLQRRLQALLAVRRAGHGSRDTLALRCSACAAPMELELDLDAFAVDGSATMLRWQAPDGARVHVRLPTGKDQARWIESGIADPPAIAASLIASIDDAPPPPSFVAPTRWLEAMGDALEARDPLTTLTLRATCPDCGDEAEHAFDLERFLLLGFARTQRALLDDVGRLAAAFHWSESAIVELPSWRRARYLQQLDAGALA